MCKALEQHDLHLDQAVMPWCSFVNTETVHLNGYWGDFLDKTGGSSAIVSYPPDQFFLLPRQLAPMIFEGLLDSYQNCPTGSIEAGYSIEEWGEIIIMQNGFEFTHQLIPGACLFHTDLSVDGG